MCVAPGHRWREADAAFAPSLFAPRFLMLFNENGSDVVESPRVMSARSKPPMPPELPRYRGSAALVYAALRQRGLAAALLATALVYFAASAGFGRPIHRCPFRAWTGLPCPGCGLSRALSRMMRGEWADSLRLHPFAFYVIVWGGMLAGSALLPPQRRLRWAAGWAALEARTRLHAAMPIAFAAYGLARLLWFALRRLG